MSLRVHGVLPESRVNGPGRRAVVHLQGCTLACPACFNPETHSSEAGYLREVEALADELCRDAPDGITVSGGEPFQQVEALGQLVRALRRRKVASILVFSGYALEEIEALPGGSDVLAEIDVLIAGRYDATRATRDPLVSSANQRVHVLSDAHRPEELGCDAGDVEITIRPDGSVTMTGFPSPGLRRAVRDLG